MLRLFSYVGLALFLAMLSVIAVPASVLAGSEGGEAMILPVDPAALIIETSAGDQQFSIEIADDGSQRSAGLMFRTRMNDNHGMLFVFEAEGHLTFWMKNTPMPLDLIFIGSDGRIVGILNGEPYSLAPITPGVPAQFVLELKAGTADKTGIADGDRVRHPRIDQVTGTE